MIDLSQSVDLDGEDTGGRWTRRRRTYVTVGDATAMARSTTMAGLATVKVIGRKKSVIFGKSCFSTVGGGIESCRDGGGFW